jgi:YVTN family beta-propeller protein
MPARVTPRGRPGLLVLPVAALFAAGAAVLWLSFGAGGGGAPSATAFSTAPIVAAASSPIGGRPAPSENSEPQEPTPLPTEPVASPAPSNQEAGGAPSDERRLRLVERLVGGITPKSVVSSQTGLFFVQNMMYLHTVRVYDRRFRSVGTIHDGVNLSKFGYPQFPGRVRGAPVEVAFSPDRGSAYVSQYAMFGPGFNHPGDDTCAPNWQVDRSFVYRVDVATLRKTGVVEVGSTPKFLAVTPDGKRLLVSNWCSGDVTIVDLPTFQPIRRVRVGWHPRGLAFDTGSNVAYVAVWDLTAVAKIDLRTFEVTYVRNVGHNPRHLLMDPSGRYLYASLNGGGRIAKVDTATDRVVARVHTGREPRSMAIAADGRSLYVVNYTSGTASKVRTRDMTVLQTVRTDHHPIGITYDNATHQVWIACYSGTLRIYRDT